MLITPPNAQLHIDPATSAGSLAQRVVGAIGVQGATITGTHGIGVNTPSAAAVAAATVGLDSDMHIPKGTMLTIGAMSMMVATGRPSTMALGTTTFSVDGAIPNVQLVIAPATTTGLPTAGLLTGFEIHSFDPFTVFVNGCPVVVAKHSTVRSLPCSQLRAEGSR
jgi:hypothetical protein